MFGDRTTRKLVLLYPRESNNVFVDFALKSDVSVFQLWCFFFVHVQVGCMSCGSVSNRVDFTEPNLESRDQLSRQGRLPMFLVVVSFVSWVAALRGWCIYGNIFWIFPYDCSEHCKSFYQFLFQCTLHGPQVPIRLVQNPGIFRRLWTHRKSRQDTNRLTGELRF